MCLAIFKPAGQSIDPEHLTNAAERNPDGGGIAYTDGSTMTVEKGFFDGAETIIKLLEELESVPALVHFRWSTQGDIDDTNCHPFIVGDWAMIHNGHIPCVADHPKHSDTYLYASDKMARRVQGNPQWPLLPRSAKKMSREIGASKLAFLRENGDSLIVNEKQGSWVDGVWFSNDGYKKYTPTAWAGFAPRPITYWRSGWDTVGDEVVIEAPINEWQDSYEEEELIEETCGSCGKDITTSELVDAHDIDHEYGYDCVCVNCWQAVTSEARLLNRDPKVHYEMTCLEGVCKVNETPHEYYAG